MKKYLLLLLILILSGCATEDKYRAQLNTYFGYTQKELIDAWGPPDSTYKLDNKTEYFTYTKSRDIFIPASDTTNLYGSSFTTNYYGGYTENLNCKTTFTLENGTVTNYRFDGNDCTAM